MLNTKSFGVIDAQDIKGNIHIVGCGALGSKVAVNLIRLNLTSKIIAYDFDEVEEKNLNNQEYFRMHIGMPKVAALANLASMIDDEAILRTKNKKVEYIRTKTNDVVILALDDFHARGKILDNIEGYPLVIVMGANARGGNVEVYRVNYKDAAQQYLNMESGQEYDEADRTACGSPISISHRLNSVASIAAEQLIENYSNTETIDANIIYEVPINFLVKS